MNLRPSAKLSLAIGLFLTIASGCFGQQAASPAKTVRDNFAYINRKILTMAKDFPEDKYDYRMKPEMRSFGEVIVRNPLTLQPVAPGEHGIVQVCSVLPTSFPGHLLLTEDMAKVMAYDGCPCGRRGISFRFAGRIPKAEVRGCGNLQSKRSPAS